MTPNQNFPKKEKLWWESENLNKENYGRGMKKPKISKKGNISEKSENFSEKFYWCISEICSWFRQDDKGRLDQDEVPDYEGKLRLM